MSGGKPDDGLLGIDQNVAEAIFAESTLYSDLRQDVVFTTSDKLRLRLAEYRKRINKRQRPLLWLGFALSAWGALTTGKFERVVAGVPGAAWLAVFMLVAAISTVLLVVTTVRAAGAFFRGQAPEEQFITEATTKKLSDVLGGDG